MRRSKKSSNLSPAIAMSIVAMLIAGACSSDGSNELLRAEPNSTTVPDSRAEPAPSSTTTSAPVPVLRAPTLADSAADLANRLVAAETLLRSSTSGDEIALDIAAFEAQVLYRQLGRTPAWDVEVFEQVPSELAPTVTNHIEARRTLRAMHRKLSTTLPPWRIVEPVDSASLEAMYRAGETEFGVPWSILAAVNLVETGFGRIRGTSTAGAQGPMQFIPSTWDAFGEGDINDPNDAIRAAARYLAHNGGGSGDIDNALFRYNNSSRYVDAVKRYASIIQADPLALDGLHRWQIVYLSAAGEAWLPVGYEETEPVDAAEHLTRSPELRLTPGPV